MSKRLGSGEFERTDVEVRQSTLEARYIFLKILFERKPHCFINLLRMFNTENILKDDPNNEEIDNTIYSVFSYLINKKLDKTKLNPEFIDTPLLNYYAFSFAKEKEIQKIEFGEEPNSFEDRLANIIYQNNTLKQIIPNWATLKNHEEAKNLWQSLELWANHHNLNEEWCLDFALQVLQNFKSNLDFELLKFAEDGISLDAAHSFRVIYEDEANESIATTRSNYMKNVVWYNQMAGFEDLENFPPFQYRLRDLELPSLTWIPSIDPRSEFVKEVSEKLEDSIKSLNEIPNIWKYSTQPELNRLLEEVKSSLNKYCDYIEQHKYVNLNEIEFPRPNFEKTAQLIWDHAKQSREVFIEQTFIKLKIQIEKLHNIEESLQQFAKKDFEMKLMKYCNEIETFSAGNFVRTPKKHTENKHFEWLVEYQVFPYKNYRDISRENNVDLKTVREGIQKTSDIINISLRKVIKTGRPKGTKNSRTSNRQLEIHKK